MNNAQTSGHQFENFPVDSKKISKIVDSCRLGQYVLGREIVEEFSQLNSSEKKELGKRISSLYVSVPSVLSLEYLLGKGSDSIELYECVIKAIEDYIQSNPQPFNPVESKDHPLNSLLRVLFDPRNQTMKFQRQILILLIEYYQRNEGLLGLGRFTMHISVIRQAMEFGADDAAVYVLNRYGNSLKSNHFCQGLLKNVCDSQFTKPRAIMKLVELDAKLPSDNGRPSLKIQFDESFSDELNPFDKSSSDESNMPEFVKLLNDSKIQIPVTPEYFTNDGGIKKKGLFVQSAFKDCDDLVWRALEQAMIKSARDRRDNHDAKYSHLHRAFNRLNQIVLDNIKIVFDINPKHKLSNPKEFEYIAFISIYKQHPLIHILLERGLKLNQALSSDAWPNRDPFAEMSIEDFYSDLEERRAFSCTQGNTLGDLVAFYSSDLELLKKLSTIHSTNKFGRTPSHYAVLAALALEDARIDRWVALFKGGTVAQSVSYRKELYLDGMENLTNEKMNLLNQNQPAYVYHYYLFNLNKIVACFMPKYSQLAFENSNLAAHVNVPDLIGFTPIDYAHLITDQAKKGQIFRTFFFNLLTPVLSSLLPALLIRHISEYLPDPLSKKETDYLIISGAEKLIANASLLTHQFQDFLLTPIKPFLDKNYQFILDSNNFQVMVGVARTVLQIFNYMTFAGTVSHFESILAEPTDSKAHLTEPHLTTGFSFTSNQITVFPSSGPSSPNNTANKLNRKRKQLGDNESNDPRKK